MSAHVIDVHAHILPPVYLDAMVAAGLADDAGRPVGDGLPFPAWTLGDTLRVMNRNSIRARQSLRSIVSAATA